MISQLTTPVGTGPAPGGAQAAGALMAFPPELYPPPGHMPFFLSATVNTAAAGSHLPAALSVVIPENAAGVIRSLDLFVDAPDLTQEARWAILVNGSPLPGFGNLTIIGRAAGSIVRTLDISAKLPPGALVQIKITNVDGAPRLLGAQANGWFWPRALHVGS